MNDTPVDFHHDLRHLLKWRPPRLRFDDLDEQHFIDVCGPARIRHFIVSGIIALVAFNLFLITDYTMVPDVFEMAWHIRCVGFSIFAGVLIFFATRLRGLVLLLPNVFVEGAVMMTGVAAAWTMAWLLLHSSSPYAGMFLAGLVPILIYGNLVQRFRFKYALVFSCVVLLTTVWCAWSRHGKGLGYEMFDVPLVLLIAVIGSYTLVMNYRIELEERRRFMWSLRATSLHKKLAASKEELDAMSRQDPLTGVPNRRQFDDYLRAHWTQLEDTDGELALLLMDVDHFKAFNDHYGHPAGDQCLRHVAQALQQALPADTGCVARWGGEEFIVGLPGMDAHGAMRVAQRLCESVRALGLRHEASKTASCVTISVGVAVARPRASVTTEELVAQADAALYRAKRGGRNQCMLAGEKDLATA